MSFVTTLVGLLVFVMLYMQFINGNPGIIIQKPITLLLIVAPFLPAMLLMILAKNARRNMNNIVFEKPDYKNKRTDLFSKEKL